MGRNIRWISIMLFVLLAGLYATGQAQEMVATRRNAPEIVRGTPATATAGTELELEGYRLGWPDANDLQILFVQGNAQYAVRPTGGGWQGGNLDGLQHMKVTVPEGVTPGSCQIYILANGLTSSPIAIEIALMVSPPVISELSPHWAQPGEVIWVSGTGFAIDDEIDLIDAQGHEYHFAAGSTSSGMKTAFTLPDNLPDGEVKLWVVEKRSGTDQYSNPISLSVSNGPIPLELWGNWLNPVAAGQWLDLVVTSVKPLEHADRAELLFIQPHQRLIAPIIDNNYPRVHVPADLAPGEVKLSTRTWRGNHPSVWSEPISYQLLASPSAPKVMSIEATTLTEPIYLGGNAPETLAVSAGESLILRGRFPVSTFKNLRLLLTHTIDPTVDVTPGERIVLTPIGIDPGGLKVVLPKEMRAGNWQLSIRSLEDNVTGKLPIQLHIN